LTHSIELLHTCIILSLFKEYANPRYLHSFPTRRSSDLIERIMAASRPCSTGSGTTRVDALSDSSTKPNSPAWARAIPTRNAVGGDRKSTRLNSSHLVISYAVFCLKKKKNTI